MGFLVYEDISAFICSLVLPAAETFKYRNELASFLKYAAQRFQKHK